MTHKALIREKLDQAVAILQEQDVDAWMTFVRETSLGPDPSLDLILGMDMVWQSAFIVTRGGERIAIVGKHDAENIRELGAYTQVITYLEGIREKLVQTLLDLDPRQIALNYSENDVAADGISHGLMLLLQRYVTDTDLAERFISAEEIVGAVRGRKSPAEIERVRGAIAATQALFEEASGIMQPGMNEVEIAAFIHRRINEQGLGTAWDWEYCPIVDCGPESPIGHAGPQEKYTVQPGTLVHMDCGVMQNEYCADLQRVWFVRHADEKPPTELQEAFNAARKALLAGFDALKPGTRGWQVDQAARQSLIDAGYPAYQHAFGHHVGRSAHDGATVLGPRWERYGETPYGIVEIGNIFAIELGVEVKGFGYIGLEENVLVTEDGAEWLSDPQTEIWVI